MKLVKNNVNNVFLWCYFSRDKIIPLLSLMVPLIALSFAISSPSVRGAEEEKQQDCFVRAFRGGSPEPIAVKGASYLLLPDNSDGKTFLSCDHQGALKFSQDINRQSLFYFEEVGNIERMGNMPHRFYLRNLDSDAPVQSEDKEYCVAVLKGNGKFQLVFESRPDDKRPFLLRHDLGKNKVVLDHYPLGNIDSLHFWTLKPVYEFLSLNFLNVDPNTLLFKIPKKEKISNRMLSTAQVLGLYDLQNPDDDSKRLTVVWDDTDFVLAHTPTLSYVSGLYITSADFPLKIHNIKGFWTCVGNYAESSESLKEKRKFNAEDSIELNRGQILFLRPGYKESREKCLSVGKVEIIPGVAGWISNSFDKTRVKIKEIINKPYSPYPVFSVEIQGDTIHFHNISGNLFQPAPLLYTTFRLGQLSITHAGDQLWRAADRLGSAAENLGEHIESSSKNIEKATKQAGDAFIESSKNISDAMICSANVLANTLNFASMQFNNALRSLSLDVTNAARGISTDIKENTEMITKSLKDTALILNHALSDVATKIESSSRNLENGAVNASYNLASGAVKSSQNVKSVAKEISGGLRDAASSFDSAFAKISNAFEKGTENIEKAIEEASDDFVKGMGKVENAAREIKQAKPVDVRICTIS